MLLLLRINLARCDVMSLGQPYKKNHLPFFEHQQPCETSRTELSVEFVLVTGKGKVHRTTSHEGPEVE
jgi:hypothetical protein